MYIDLYNEKFKNKNIFSDLLISVKFFFFIQSDCDRRNKT